MVSQETGSPVTGELLNTFVTHNRSRFPLLVRVTDWKEETSILENHVVRPGVQLVVHGWTRQTKVLAKAGRLYYAVPLTYGGKFRVRVKTFSGAVQLWNAQPKSCLRVFRPDLEDPSLVSVGDLLRLKRPQYDEDDDEDDDDHYADGDRRSRGVRETKKFLRCEKIHPGSGAATDFRIPLTCSARFEEVLEDVPANPESVQIRDLVKTLTCRDVEVELVSPSPDRPAKDRDLPDRVPILLSDNVTEQAVYVSVESPTAPAFHLPLRTLIYVTVIRGLDKRCSPLLMKQAPKLSTLDRCVELLPPDVFDSLRPSQRSFESPDFVAEESRPSNKVIATPSAAHFDASSEDSRTSAAYSGSLAISIKASNGPQKHSKPVSSSILPRPGSVQDPVAYIDQPPGQIFLASHGESQYSLSQSSLSDSDRMNSISVELPGTVRPYSGQHHLTSMQNQSARFSEGYQNYQSQALQSQGQLIHAQTQSVQPQTHILQTQTHMLQPQAQFIQSQVQYTQPQVQAAHHLALVQQPQFQTIEPQSQTFQPQIQSIQPHVESNQSQTQTIQPQVQFTHTYMQPLQAQQQMPQAQMQVIQPHLQPQWQMAQPQIQISQPQLQITQPQLQLSQPQLQLAQPQMQLGQPHIQFGQPSMLGFQPQSQITSQQVAMGQPHMQMNQPQMQLTQPQMQLTQPQMQMTESQVQLTQPQMQWTQMQLPQVQLQLIQQHSQGAQPYQPTQLETQQASLTTLTGPPPVFKKKGRAPTIPQTSTAHAPSPAPSFHTITEDMIQPLNQVAGAQPLSATQRTQPGQFRVANTVDPSRWIPESQNADLQQRAQQQQQQQPEFPTEVPPGFGLVPLQSTNGFAIPPGFVLVPISNTASSVSTQQTLPLTNTKQVKFSHPGNDDDSSEDDVKPEAEVVAKKVAGFKLKIPDDGNLYDLSSKRFAELLAYLRIDPEAMKTMKKANLDGKKFAGLSEEDLILNPVLMHFRRLTEKQQRKKSFVL